MSAPHITWVFEAISTPLYFTTMIPRSAPMYENLDEQLACFDELVTELSNAGYYAIRLDHREWKRWAWPGGYPIFYITKDGGRLCSRCANDNIKLTSDPQAEDDWRIVAADINYEDPDLFCDNCCERCESAYGDNNEQDKDPT